MVIGRLIAFLFWVIAATVLLRDILAWLDSGAIAFMTGAQLWFTLDPDGFEQTEGMMRDKYPSLWDPAVSTLLDLPAFLVFLFLGLLLMYLFRTRKKRRRR